MFLRKLPQFLSSAGSVRCLITCQSVKATRSPPQCLSMLARPLPSPWSTIPDSHRINILDLPFPSHKIIQDVPFKIIQPLEDKVVKDVISDPTQVIEQQAARLIVIRRRKMKRHKLKKLRKKMRFIWGKVRQRRELRKEKAFQAELMGQISEAEKFNAAIYAREKIDKANAEILPKLWKGKRLPEFVIRDLLREQALKKKIQQENLERRKNMSLKVSDYKV